MHVETRALRRGLGRAAAGSITAAPALGVAVGTCPAPAAPRRPARPAPTRLRARLPPPVGPAGPGPVVVGGGGCPGALCLSCPTRQHRLSPQPSYKQRRHNGEWCCAHRAPTDPLPSPCRRGLCSSSQGRQKGFGKIQALTKFHCLWQVHLAENLP